MHENKFNSYKVPSGLLILFLEKALTLLHMETHLTDVSIASLRSFTFLSRLLNLARSRTAETVISPKVRYLLFRARSQESARYHSLYSPLITATYRAVRVIHWMAKESSSKRWMNYSITRSNIKIGSSAATTVSIQFPPMSACLRHLTY